MSQVSASMPIAPGFSDAVIDSQEAFRCILAALSRPGRIESIRRLPDCPPAMASVTAAIALTLFDFDTPVWLDPAAGDIGSELFLRFHCGCAVTDRPEQARFAIVGDALNMPRLAAFHPGDALYPDRSATVIVQLPTLDGGPQRLLSGPGVEHTQIVAPEGLPHWFWSDWADNVALYPQGIDVLLIAGSAILGLPRSIRAKELSCTLP